MRVTLILNCLVCGDVEMDLYDDDLDITIDVPNLKYTIKAECPECEQEIETTLAVSELEADLIKLLPTEELANVYFVEK